MAGGFQVDQGLLRALARSYDAAADGITDIRVRPADAVAALFVAALAVREGVEAWRGDVESPFEILGDLRDQRAFVQEYWSAREQNFLCWCPRCYSQCTVTISDRVILSEPEH